MYLRDLQDEDFEVAIKVELLLISKLVEVFNGTNRSNNLAFLSKPWVLS